MSFLLKCDCCHKILSPIHGGTGLSLAPLRGAHLKGEVSGAWYLLRQAEKRGWRIVDKKMICNDCSKEAEHE